MKKIFVCSPLRGNFGTNRTIASLYCRIISLRGDLPIAPHVYFTRFLDDNVEEERRLGIKMGLELLKDCHEIWVFTDSLDTITEGMKEEIDEATKLGLPIIYIMPIRMERVDQVNRRTLKELKINPYGHNYNHVIHCANCSKLVWVKTGSIKSSMAGSDKILTMEDENNVCQCGYVDDDLLEIAGGPSTTFGFGQEIWVSK